MTTDEASALMAAWGQSSGLAAWLVFEPFDGPVERAEGLVIAPLARIVTRATKTHMHLAAHIRQGGAYAPLVARTERGARAATYLLHGAKIGPCTIEWSRDKPDWLSQLKAHGLKVFKVL